MSRDIPIIFSGPMVRALLEGRKTITRRLAWRVKMVELADGGKVPSSIVKPSPWQKVKSGDRLWVRENLVPTTSGIDYEEGGDECLDLVSANQKQSAFWDRHALKRGDPINAPTVPCIHMPRWASRLTLVVTATKIERLQAISDDDVRAEGTLLVEGGLSPASAWAQLWDSIHSEGAWLSNPEVVALTFKVIKQNIDSLPKQEAA